MSRSLSPRSPSPSSGGVFLLAPTSASLRPVHPDGLEWLSATDGGGDAGHFSLSSALSSSSTSPCPSYAAEVEGLQMEADRLCSSRLKALSMEHEESGEERKGSGSDASGLGDERKRKRRGGGRRGHWKDRKQRRGLASGRRRRSGREEEKEAVDAATASDSSRSDSGEGDNEDAQSNRSADSARAAPAVEAEKERRSKLPLKSVYHLRAFFTAHVQYVRARHRRPSSASQVRECGLLPADRPRRCALRSSSVQPYPSEEEKRTLADETGLTVKQITVRLRCGPPASLAALVRCG